MTASSAPFGRLADGANVSLYRLQNDRVRASVIDYGGRLASLEIRRPDGGFQEVLLGFDTLDGYLASGSFAAIIGRVANRISDGSFALDGRRFTLTKNEPTAILHGGPKGLGKLLWSAVAHSDDALTLERLSPDGDQGFPGNLEAKATYRITEAGLRLTLEARVDAPCPVSLSAHPYFNLADPTESDALACRYTIFADRFLPTDAAQRPTGEIRAVEGGPFDFREPRCAARSIRTRDPQLLIGHGYDHYFVLPPSDGRELRRAARVASPDQRLALELWTTQPGVQFYTGNSFNGSAPARSGFLRQSAGFALEPHGFPDAPNRPEFPSITLRPGETYRHEIDYRFEFA